MAESVFFRPTCGVMYKAVMMTEINSLQCRLVCMRLVKVRQAGTGKSVHFLGVAPVIVCYEAIPSTKRFALYIFIKYHIPESWSAQWSGYWRSKRKLGGYAWSICLFVPNETSLVVINCPARYVLCQIQQSIDWINVFLLCRHLLFDKSISLSTCLSFEMSNKLWLENFLLIVKHLGKKIKTLSGKVK